MPINPALLVQADVLQCYFVDKMTGGPLAGGIIRLYENESRTTYKNWYYQTGTPGAYTYLPLPNPLTLSSVGTIQDANGNDVIPFYYPFEEDNQNIRESYYITVYSSYNAEFPDLLQFTRENFPYSPASSPSPISTSPTFRNYILNNVYWRNIGSANLNTTTNLVIAPSQHEGYVGNGDIRFLKNITGATDTLTFAPMTVLLNNDITPEYSLNFTCAATQSGETQKCIQYPISLHVDTLSSVNASLVFHGQSVLGNANNYVDLYIYQYLGAGALAQPAPILIQRLFLTNSYEKYVIPFIFPNSTGLALGGGGDDALFLQVQYPLSATCAINHTKPQIYLSPTVPDNNFDTYDQIEGIINSPRTGDVRTTLDTSIFGYVPANNGTIGNANSHATSLANVAAWPLFSLLWPTPSSYLPMFTSAGVPAARGASAIADFNANRQLCLTRTMGQVLAGSNLYAQPAQNFSTSVASNVLITVTNAAAFGVASPVILTGSPPSGLSVGVVYYTIVTSATTIELASTIANALAGTPITFSASSGSGTIQIQALGSSSLAGELAHTLTVGEMPSHNHSMTRVFAGAGIGSGTSFASDTAGTTGNTGGGAAHNNVQPTTYMNMYIKL